MLPATSPEIVSLPEVDLSPLQLPDAEQLVAWVDDQLSVNAAPINALSVEAESERVGVGSTGSPDRAPCTALMRALKGPIWLAEVVKLLKINKATHRLVRSSFL